MASCTTDVVVNAVVLFWLTKPGYANDEPTSHGGYGGNHGPGHHNRSENGKSLGGVVQMHRISVSPGMHGSSQTGSFNGTTSLNGISRSSTGPRTPGDSDGPPRSPMKVNFSDFPHSGVYDGSQSYVREGHSTSTEDKTPGLLDSPTSPTFSRSQAQRSSFLLDQRRQSAGIVYEKKVAINDPPSTSPTGFLNRLMGRLSPTFDSQRSPVSASGPVTAPYADGGRSGRMRRGSDEDPSGVRITVTTMLENDDSTTINVADSNDPNSSREDQSKTGSPRVV